MYMLLLKFEFLSHVILCTYSNAVACVIIIYLKHKNMTAFRTITLHKIYILTSKTNTHTKTSCY